MENKINIISEKEILIAATEYSGIKADRNDYDEQYFNKSGCNMYDAFKAGIKWYQEELERKTPKPLYNYNSPDGDKFII